MFTVCHSNLDCESSTLTTRNSNVQKTGTGLATAESQLSEGDYTHCDEY